MKRRALSFAFAVVMLLSLIPTISLPAAAAVEDHLIYDEATKFLTITGELSDTDFAAIKNYNKAVKVLLKNVKRDNCYEMFKGFKALKEVEIDGLEATSVSHMFGTTSYADRCKALTTVKITNWDSSTVTNMSHMFYYCTALTSVDCARINTSKVKDFSYMFTYCKLLEELSVADWDVSSATNMSNMFAWCQKLEALDTSKWDVSKVTDMSYMFAECNTIQEFSVANWDVSSVTDMSYMFKKCNSAENIPVKNWDVSKVTDFTNMFRDCDSLVSINPNGYSMYKVVYKTASKVLEKYGGFANVESTIEIPIKTFESHEFISLTAADSSGNSVTMAENKFQLPAEVVNVTVLYSDPHAHSFTHAANGGVLSAVCTDGCPDGYDTAPLTLTLNAPGGTYDGATFPAAFETGEAAAWEAALGTGTVPAIKYLKSGETAETTDAPKKAGSYTAKITVDGKTAELNFTIDKAEITVSGITAKDKQYDGKTAAELEFSGVTLEGVIGGDDLSVTATGTFADAQVGKDKTVTISGLTLTGNDKDNYVLADSGQQANATATITCDGLAAANEAHNWSDGKCTFCSLECSHNWANAKANKAGTSTLVSEATCEDDAVYHKVCSICDEIGNDTWTDTASKLGHGDWAYSASNNVLTATCGHTGCTDPAFSVSLTLNAPVGAVYDGTSTFPVAFNDGEETAWVDVFGTGTAPKIEYYAGDSATPLGAEPVNAGTYTAKITADGKTAQVTYEVAKGDPSYTAPTGLTAEYGQTLADVTLPTGFTWQDADTTSVGTVGNNTFKATFTPNDTTNYNAVSDIDVTVSVACNDHDWTNADGKCAVCSFECDHDGKVDGVCEICGKDLSVPHSHVWDTAWTNDETGHWHECTGTDCDITDYSTCTEAGAAYGTHDWTNKDGKCAICSFECDHDGKMDGVCAICGKKLGGKTIEKQIEGDISEADVEGLDAFIYTLTDDTVVMVRLTVEKPMFIPGTIRSLMTEVQQAKHLNISVKTIDENGKTRPVTDTGTILSIRVPFDFTGVKDGSVKVIREHNGAAEFLQENPASGQEGFTVDKAAGTVTIHASKFSTYAIVYEEEQSDPDPAPVLPTAYPVVGPATTENGRLTITPSSAAAGEKITLTAKPDEGYELYSITVIDKNGSEIKLTDLGDGRFSFVMPAGKVTVAVSFKASETSEPGEPASTVCPKDSSCPLNQFGDTDANAWYHDGIEYCLNNGLMKGVSDSEFGPTGTTSRAMIVTILWRLEGEKYVNYAMNFSDVAEGEWYTEPIRWAASEGIVEGYDDGTYQPDKAITREELATILYRYAQLKGEGFVGASMFLMPFEDLSEISGWASESVRWCFMKGIILGRTETTFVPGATATRAEAAAMVQRFCQNLGK